MMVTFISQCEKNALKRTRRILDSFANRIGNNTWQTIITKEGLNAVQKLLRKTASKSTAVSCHWIRSRSRSDFLWVVGNRDEFDENGIVAVNYGVTKRFIGEKEIMLENIYANTNGQRLDQHLFAVGYVAKGLIKKTIPNDENLAEAVYVAGCWHDIGKIDGSFQNWVKLNKKFKEIPEEGEHIDKQTGKFSWQKYPRHNEFSLLLCEIVFDVAVLNNAKTLDIIKHAVYWHHAKPLRNSKDEIKGIVGIYNKIDDFEHTYSAIIDNIKGVFESIDEMANRYDEDLKVSHISVPRFDDIEERLEGVDLPKYKRYSTKEKLEGYKLNIGVNAKNALARTAIVTADRLVSALTADELREHINNKTLESLFTDALDKKRGLGVEIQTCLDGFISKYPNSERNEPQKKVAKELADKEINIAVLKGSAGCGKTKIALEWALETSAKRIYWVCPRVQVCEGIYADLSSNEYLPNSSIEIVTGDIKKRRFTGKEQETPENEIFASDIVITTIDQIVNSITTHKQITSLMDFMNAHVVFDEYHEYINMQGFNLLFAELIEAKKLQQEYSEDTYPNTLLVSATPNPLFVKEFLRLDDESIVGMKSFNDSDYKIEFIKYDDNKDDANPLMQEQKSKNTFLISNTAIMAQRSFIEHQSKENAILFHSKFIKKDKEYLFGEIFNSFKKEGTKKYNVLRSGPVIQASLNITCDKMISEMTHAENFLQRLGRLDRFGENSTINQYIIAITEGVKNGKSIDGSSRFLSKLDSLRSTKVWYEFLQNNKKERYTINDIYELYEAFYNDDNTKEAIRQDLIASLKKSVEVIDAKVLDPKSFPKSKKDEKGGVKIKKNSLRGNSLFVQMAQCKIESVNKFEILDEYAYEELNDAITLETSVIEGYGFDGKPDSKKNLLGFMAQKHHNIKGVKAQKDAEIRMKARDPITPIYLSYTLEELSTWSMEPHEYAQYYAIGLKQPIGILSLQQLKK